AAAPIPTTSASSASGRRRDLPLMRDLVLLEEPGGRYGQEAVERGQDPKVRPVAPDVMEARAHLVDAHEPVDRRGARKDAAHRADRVGNRLDRPRDADHEKQREADGDE